MFEEDLFEEFTLHDMEEGQESKEFWDAMGGKNRHMYLSLLEDPQEYEFTPRLFELSSVSGTFSPTELTCPYAASDLACPYPFIQSDLYKAQQPGGW
ncbi:SVIL [Cordylochernes scorpioides]|uniref:SVIL n=1 Tax=Cordylochernes scorpioides TaxID=51811 RepID=A0ABY6KGE4_9ARAC|nr:SVIL [Cordylochernes scorpioides]